MYLDKFFQKIQGFAAVDDEMPVCARLNHGATQGGVESIFLASDANGEFVAASFDTYNESEVLRVSDFKRRCKEFATSHELRVEIAGSFLEVNSINIGDLPGASVGRALFLEVSS